MPRTKVPTAPAPAAPKVFRIAGGRIAAEPKRTAPTPPAPAPVKTSPDEQTVRDLAYLKWTDAGCPHGDGVEFWLEAERELASE